MGGRGSSFSNSADIALSVKGSDGNDIDLSGSPLRYGANDANLDGKARQTIEAFEDKRYKNKIEFSELIDANGNIIEDNKGGKGSVRASIYAYNRAFALSHNHPRSGIDAGVLGGTFSEADINVFTKYAQSVFRATAAEGTYSISRNKGFDSAGLRRYYSTEHANNRKAYEKTINTLNANYKTGVFKTYSEYRAATNKAFNSFF